MAQYSEMWQEPRKDNVVLMACDAKYQWMALAACVQARKFLGNRCDVEVWTWGAHKFCDHVWRELYLLDVQVCQVPNTGQYCAGWEARHHAMCLTRYRRVVMIDVDTYINDPLPDVFDDYQEDVWLFSAGAWSAYRNAEFFAFFSLPPRAEGYFNYDIHFGIYDRAKPRCREVLAASSDVLGRGNQCYREAKVVGDQDIRNGLIHKLAAVVRPSKYRSAGFTPLAQQAAKHDPILHHMGGSSKALDENAYHALSELLATGWAVPAPSGP